MGIKAAKYLAERRPDLPRGARSTTDWSLVDFVSFSLFPLSPLVLSILQSKVSSPLMQPPDHDMAFDDDGTRSFLFLGIRAPC